MFEIKNTIPWKVLKRFLFTKRDASKDSLVRFFDTSKLVNNNPRVRTNGVCARSRIISISLGPLLRHLEKTSRSDYCS